MPGTPAIAPTIATAANKSGRRAATRLRHRRVNRRAAALRFSSRTSEGRELAGYGGLFRRGPRSFRDGTGRDGTGRDGTVLTADTGGPQAMAVRSPSW
ncbi:hypothetical protein DSC45_17835 [Streptomyces sp. YIM 130001]|nr:hypothetical protein DSC45_17835 [Streptomyces sp. YIM 130001]